MGRGCEAKSAFLLQPASVYPLCLPANAVSAWEENDAQELKHPRGRGRAGRVPGNTIPWQKLFCFACRQHTGADVAFNPSPWSLGLGCRMGKKWESAWLGRRLRAEHFAQGSSGSVSHTEPAGSCQQTCSVLDSISGGGRRCQAACDPLCPSTGLLWLLCHPVSPGVPEMLLGTRGISSHSPKCPSRWWDVIPGKLASLELLCQPMEAGHHSPHTRLVDCWGLPPAPLYLSQAQPHLHSQEANQNQIFLPLLLTSSEVQSRWQISTRASLIGRQEPSPAVWAVISTFSVSLSLAVFPLCRCWAGFPLCHLFQSHRGLSSPPCPAPWCFLSGEDLQGL